MSSPVWVLSVDLTTKTATFESGMASAARSAKSSFGSIKDDAKAMGDGVNASSLNVRASLGLLDNTIRGNHAAAMADLVREFQHTSIVMAALPFAAVIGGVGALAAIAVEIAEKVKEWREEDEKLNRAQRDLHTTLLEGQNGLDDKLLQTGKRADELKNDHIAALYKELQLIDHAELGDLIKNLGMVSKAADEAFAHLESHWYTFGIGVTGAKHAFDEFQSVYKNLVSHGKTKEAGDLLAGTLGSAERILAMQKQAIATQGAHTQFGTGDFSNVQKNAEAMNALKAAGVGHSMNEVRAQEALIEALKAQADAAVTLHKIKTGDENNAKTSTGNAAAAKASEAAKQLASSQAAIAESKLQADKATANAGLEIANASAMQRLQVELDFANRDREIKLQENQADIDALNKTSDDATNQLKALNGKKLQIEAAYAAQTAELRAKAMTAQNAKDVLDYESGQRELIAATEQGSQERLDALNNAMRSAEGYGLRESDYFRELARQKVETIRQQLAEQAKLEAEAGKEQADNAEKMAMLALQAEQQFRNAMLSGRRVTDAEAEKMALEDSNRDFQIKQTALEREAAELDKTGKDYENKLKALQNKERQLIQQHENEVTAIKLNAQTQRNQRISQGENDLYSDLARSMTSVLMRNQSFTFAMISLGNKLASGMIQNALHDMMARDMSKERDAAAAARSAFLWGWQNGGPAAPILAPVMAAGAFTAMMAYSEGTDGVPGVGRGDIVPAKLTPGEGVVPGGVMDGLRSVARNGGFNGGGHTYHVHITPTYHLQALDSDGLNRVLTKHTPVLTKHFQSVVRKMNR